MTLKNIMKYIATPSKTLTTAVIILFAIFIVQIVTFEMNNMISANRWKQPSKQAEKESKTELTEEEKKLGIMSSSKKEFLPDGTIFHVKQKNNKKDLKIYDKNVNMVWEGTQKNNPYDFIAFPDTIRDSRRYNTLHRYKTITPELSRSIQIPVRTENKTLQIWRYSWNKGYFEGFASDGQKLGYLGSSGFTQTRSDATSLGTLEYYKAWCPEDSYSPTVLWLTKRKIYQINLEKQKLELLLETPDSDIVVTAWKNWKSPKEKTSDTALSSIQCQTENGKLYLITLDPEKILTINIPQDWSKETYPRLSATKTGIFLKNYGYSWTPPKEYENSIELIRQWEEKIKDQPRKLWVELYKVDDQGSLELIIRKDWAILPPKDQPRRITNRHSEKIRHYVCSVSPVIYDLPWKFWPTSLRKKLHGNDNLSTLIAEIASETRPRLSKLSWLLTIAMMLLVLVHAWPRRTTWQKITFWLIFTAVFNVGGLLTYLALNHTTVIKCPACKKRRGLERTDCIRCAKELPTPEKRKIDLILHT